MKKLYQRTFEQVLAQTCPPLNRVEEQRRALASRCSHTESEVTAMTTKPRRPIRILVAAAAVAAALTAGALGRLRRAGLHPAALRRSVYINRQRKLERTGRRSNGCTIPGERVLSGKGGA